MIICDKCKKCLAPPMYEGKSRLCISCSPPVQKKKKPSFVKTGQKVESMVELG